MVKVRDVLPVFFEPAQDPVMTLDSMASASILLPEVGYIEAYLHPVTQDL